MFFFNLSSLVWASVRPRHFEICLSENPISFAFRSVSSVMESLEFNGKERFKFVPNTVRSSELFNFKNTQGSLFSTLEYIWASLPFKSTQINSPLNLLTAMKSAFAMLTLSVTPCFDSLRTTFHVYFLKMASAFSILTSMLIQQ